MDKLKWKIKIIIAEIVLLCALSFYVIHSYMCRKYYK